MDPDPTGRRCAPDLVPEFFTVMRMLMRSMTLRD